MNDIQLLNQASSAVMRVLSENSRLSAENERLKKQMAYFQCELEKLRALEAKKLHAEEGSTRQETMSDRQIARGPWMINC